IALLLLLFLILAVLGLGVLMAIFGTSSRSETGTGGGWGYPSGSGIPPVYWPIYVVAASHYKVSPFLLASIHKQETDFSRDPSAASGVNSFGCCAGPMQFNVKAGTWRSHELAFRPIAYARPSSYPLDRRTLPSCRGVPEDIGCVYDDFDAIAGTAQMLREDGADTSLYSAGTHQAVCDYIGSCAEVDGCTGDANQYCQVLPRAREWEKLDDDSTGLVPGSTARLLPNGLAAAPADAPPAVRRMIEGANEISDKPYLLLHYPTVIDNPTYDCSSSTSYVLWRGGKFGVTPWCSSEFTHYGRYGAGKWVTIYARGPCGATGHVWMIIAGLRFDTDPREDTGPNDEEDGPRWRTPRHDLAEFVPRHPVGL
ncbi:MAG TPA: hypothetical protein VGG40_01885, partial [Solirubrobacterales bacterium]